MDHRRVQRALFRMQLDPEFAKRLRAGDAQASRGLGEGELGLLRDAAASGVSADRDGKRRAQFLSNVSSELPLSRAAGLRVDGFTESPEFHEAVSADASLPLALARYAIRCSASGPRGLRALVTLESALARARRGLRSCRTPRSGERVLAPEVTLEDVPAGTLALAARLREALDDGQPTPALALNDESAETLLLRSAPSSRPLGLREVEVERVSPALGALLRAALEPTTREALEAATGSTSAELAPILDELVADGVLLTRADGESD
jgi:hypothetical protein